MASDSTEFGGSIGNNNLNGTYTYEYTNTDSGGVNEGSPSEISKELTVEKANIVVNTSLTTTTDTHNRLYRHGGTLSTYYRLIAEILTADTSYIDNMNNQDILSEAIAPPSGIVAAPDSLQFLTYHRGRLWGANSELDANGLRIPGSRTRLMFSDLGEPLIWTGLGYLLFPEEITAIGSTPNGLVVTSLTKTYLVLGTTLTEFSILTIDNDHGCVAHQSMRAAKGLLFYAGSYGIMQTNGGTVQELSRGAIKYDFLTREPKYAAIYDSKYVLDAGERILVYDFRVGGSFYTFNKGSIDGLANINGQLELSMKGSLFSSFDGLPESMEYSSGLFTDLAPNNLKEYELVWVRFKGFMLLNIFIDTKLVVSSVLEADEFVTHRLVIPKVINKGYGISFTVSGVGAIQSLEFKNKLREN